MEKEMCCDARAMFVHVAILTLCTCPWFGGSGIMVAAGDETCSKNISNALQNAPNATGRIYGGALAELGDFPYSAFILIINNLSQYIMCTGTLLSEKTVLTAAHCTSNDPSLAMFFLQTGLIGAFGAGAYPADMQSKCGIEKYVNHPDYTEGTFNNDFSLLVLLSAFTPSTTVGVSTIARGPFPGRGELCRAVWWGSKTGTPTGKFLKWVDVWVEKGSDLCYPQATGDDDLCGVAEPGTRICLRESGIAVMCQGLLTGIMNGVSDPSMPNSCNYATNSSGIIDMTNYLDWIWSNSPDIMAPKKLNTAAWSQDRCWCLLLGALPASLVISWCIQ